MGAVVKSGSLHGVIVLGGFWVGGVEGGGGMGCQLVRDGAIAQNTRDVDSIPTLGKIFPIFITPMTMVVVT